MSQGGPDTAVFTRHFVDEARERLNALSALMLRLEERPAAADVIGDIFREAHNLKGSAQMLGFVDLAQIAHQLEEVFVAARRDGRLIDGRSFDLVFRTLDVISGRVDELARNERAPATADAPVPPADDPVSGAGGPVPVGRRQGSPAAPGSLRVSSEKLQSLAHLAPEMVLQRLKASERQAELKRVDSLLGRLRDRIREDRLAPHTRTRAAELGDYADGLDAIHRRMRSLLLSVSDDHAKQSLITEELRQHVIELTMLPVATVFDAFPRAVRDLARSFGKQVELRMSGTDTSVDKRVIEQLADSMIHLVRNAIDHGLELPAERQAAGKPAVGTLSITAEQHGDRIHIAVHDDGRGIDPERLRQVIIRKGIAPASDVAAWNHDRLLDVIFEPGFSTRTEATDISGRGVGMDVVRVTANRLGGSVSVSSESGRGTQVLLDLPLSLAMTRVVLVSVNDEVLAIPTTPIRRILRLSGQDAANAASVIHVDGEAIPLTSLARVLALPGPRAPEQSALIIEVRGSRIAVSVDAVLEEQELVFQELRGPLQDQTTMSGAAILGNGEIVPILDVQSIAERVDQHREPEPEPVMVPAPERVVQASGRILVVEDSLVAGELLTGILSGAGYDAALSHSGVAALEVLRRAEWDLVISDVDMPEMDGFEFTEQLRGDPRLRDTPIIIVTSRDADEFRRRGTAAGADAYMSKGAFDHHLLLETVRRLMAHGRGDVAQDPREHA
jgi:two-component system chemotaxis sensor kinase CheA